MEYAIPEEEYAELDNSLLDQVLQEIIHEAYDGDDDDGDPGCVNSGPLTSCFSCTFYYLFAPLLPWAWHTQGAHRDPEDDGEEGSERTGLLGTTAPPPYTGTDPFVFYSTGIVDPDEESERGDLPGYALEDPLANPPPY